MTTCRITPPNIGIGNAYIKVERIRPEDQRYATPGSINGMGNGDDADGKIVVSAVNCGA
jgi:hypothetical protein